MTLSGTRMMRRREMLSSVRSEDNVNNNSSEEDIFHFQVLDELGLQMTDQITGLPVAGSTIGTAAKGQKAPVAAAEVNLFYKHYQCILTQHLHFRELMQIWMMI